MSKQKQPSKPSKFDLTKFTFLSDTCLVRAYREDKVGELIRPEQYDDKPEFGTVIAIGPGKMLDNGLVAPMPVVAGDFVYFGKYTSEQTRVLGEDYFVIRAEDIRAVQKK